MKPALIETIILDAVRTINFGREPADQIPVSVDALLFGADSTLDSLGLVALLMEVEEGFLDAGFEISLNDERAMSQRNNPFRSVATLAAYIESLLEPESV